MRALVNSQFASRPGAVEAELHARRHERRHQPRLEVDLEREAQVEGTVGAQRARQPPVARDAAPALEREDLVDGPVTAHEGGRAPCRIHVTCARARAA
jgi:hypothetical protein